jgi:hypothetical protein
MLPSRDIISQIDLEFSGLQVHYSHIEARRYVSVPERNPVYFDPEPGK